MQALWNLYSFTFPCLLSNLCTFHQPAAPSESWTSTESVKANATGSALCLWVNLSEIFYPCTVLDFGFSFTLWHTNPFFHPWRHRTGLSCPSSVWIWSPICRWCCSWRFFFLLLRPWSDFCTYPFVKSWQSHFWTDSIFYRFRHLREIKVMPRAWVWL